MAAVLRENRRRNRFEDTRRVGGVDGSLALKPDYALRQREFEHAGEGRPEERVRVLPRPKTRPRAHVPLLGLITAAMLAGFAILVLMNYIELTRLSAETVELKAMLTEQQERNGALNSQYERMFDMEAVKSAAEDAGMVKPGSSQVVYVDLARDDSASVFRQRDRSLLGYLAESVAEGVQAVKEYFN